MSAVVPSLTFKEKGEEAMKLYTSLIKNSRIVDVKRWETGGPMPAGTLMHGEFELDGAAFTAMDGGPTFKFEEGFSLVATCHTQEELDHIWETLSGNGGEEGRCGWLKDRWGVSWQVVPAALGEMLGDDRSGSPAKMMEALLKMNKLDIAALKKAYQLR
jgi:predicted 3-demethylubiquinone-9 3-methyltransferase (glyoxalase superfamily)